jgi:hypothetical protein
MRVKQLIGWYGVGAILVAFVLLNFRTIGTDNLMYQLLNITGAVGVIVEASSRKDFQPVVLNIVWMLVALYGLLRLAF